MAVRAGAGVTSGGDLSLSAGDAREGTAGSITLAAGAGPTASSGGRVDIVDASGASRIGVGNAGDVSVSSRDGEDVRVESGGDVSIGSSGEIRLGVDGAAAAGGVVMRVQDDRIVSHVPAELPGILEREVEAQGADLVVMASHVPGLLDHIFTSNAGHVATHSAASVFIVRG